MSLMDKLLRRAEPKVERRAALMGPTHMVLTERAAFLGGGAGIAAEATAAAQACVSMWEAGFTLADVSGTSMLGRATMAMIGRQLALQGEAVFLVRDSRLVPVSHWDVATRWGEPYAYRVHVSEAGGATGETALAAEVLHFRIGADPVQPWVGRPPLRRCPLSADLLAAVEGGLAEAFTNAPLGSQIVPFPETDEEGMAELGASFRARRGRVLLRESVHVSAAGGPAPAQDWKPSDLTPDLSRVEPRDMLAAARGAIYAAFGVLPSLFADAAQGPLVREAQRHLAQLVLQPMAALMAEEATAKLGTEVKIDVVRPMQAFDHGAKARALATMIEALARAKEAGIDPAAVKDAESFIDWAE